METETEKLIVGSCAIAVIGGCIIGLLAIYCLLL